MKKLLFVFNPHAGKGQIKDNLCDIIDIFTKNGYEVLAYPTQAKGDGHEKIKKDGMNFDLIVTSGGDGTLSEAVSAMVNFNVKIPLGYIPAGSTNDVANSLSISKNMTDCAEEIMNGVYFDYDVGWFNEKNFVYVAGFGAFTDVSYETPQATKNIFGHAAYVAEAIKRLNKIVGYEITVEHDGEAFTGNYILGLISNSVSIGGMKKLIADGVRFDDGLFEVVLVKTPTTTMELNMLLTEAAINKLSDKRFVTFKTSEVKFRSNAQIAWTLDGESGGKHKDVEIKNLKQAVRLILPPNEHTSEQCAVRLNDAKKDDILEYNGAPIVFEDQTEIEV